MAVYIGGIKVAGFGSKVVYCNSVFDYQHMEHDPNTIYVTPKFGTDAMESQPDANISVVPFDVYKTAYDADELNSEIIYLTTGDAPQYLSEYIDARIEKYLSEHSK